MADQGEKAWSRLSTVGHKRIVVPQWIVLLTLLTVFVGGGATCAWECSRRDTMREWTSPDGKYRVAMTHGRYSLPGNGDIVVSKRREDRQFWQGEWIDVTSRKISHDSIVPAYEAVWDTDQQGGTRGVLIHAGRSRDPNTIPQEVFRWRLDANS